MFLKTFIFRKSNDSVKLITLKDTKKLLHHSRYDRDRPTKIYCYGYTENFMSPGTQAIVDSYLERGDHNIIVIEWSSYNDGNYIIEAIPNMKRISHIIGNTLLDMKSLGFKLEKFHLIGHSLGGQMVGYIGRSVYHNSNKTIKMQRITALDPAGPFFYDLWSTLNKPISKDDGKTGRGWIMARSFYPFFQQYLSTSFTPTIFSLEHLKQLELLTSGQTVGKSNQVALQVIGTFLTMEVRRGMKGVVNIY